MVWLQFYLPSIKPLPKWWSSSTPLLIDALMLVASRENGVLSPAAEIQIQFEFKQVIKARKSYKNQRGGISTLLAGASRDLSCGSAFNGTGEFATGLHHQ